MKIIDEKGEAILNPDLEKGYLIPDRILIAHHPAVPAVAEKWHYETVRVYPNGGKDVLRIVDTPEQIASDAWDEYENLQRYIAYTPEEITEHNKPTAIEILQGQIAYIAMVTEHMEVLQNAQS